MKKGPSIINLSTLGTILLTWASLILYVQIFVQSYILVISSLSASLDLPHLSVIMFYRVYTEKWYPTQYNSKCIRRFRLGENGRKRLWKWKRFGRSDEARCELGVNSVWVLSKINSTLNRIVFTQFSWFEGTH